MEIKDIEIYEFGSVLFFAFLYSFIVLYFQNDNLNVIAFFVLIIVFMKIDDKLQIIRRRLERGGKV